MNKISAFRIFFVTFIICLSGCQTVKPVTKSKIETRKDIQSAIESVAQAMSGKSLSKEELHNFKKQLRTDKDAQSAIKVISNSMNSTQVKIKYCPITGRRYAPRLKICPEHQIKLKDVEG